MKEEKPPAPEYTEVKGLKPLKRYVAEYLQLKAQEKELKARKDELQDLVMPLLVRAGVGSVRVDGEPVTMVEGSYSAFDKKKLVEIPFPCPHCRSKVTLPGEVVQKATTMKDRKPYVLIGASRKEEE